LLSCQSGWGIPDVHPAVKELLARAWVLRPSVAPGQLAFDADLHSDDATGANWALLDRAEWDPTVINPGAILSAGQPGAAAEVLVLRTVLLLASSGTVMVLVTFTQTASLTLERALSGD